MTPKQRVRIAMSGGGGIRDVELLQGGKDPGTLSSGGSVG